MNKMTLNEFVTKWEMKPKSNRQGRLFYVFKGGAKLNVFHNRLQLCPPEHQGLGFKVAPRKATERLINAEVRQIGEPLEFSAALPYLLAQLDQHPTPTMLKQF